MTGEFAASDAQPNDAHEERLLEIEQTRAALQNASDALVDMTIQTPWERQREEAKKEDEQRMYGYLEQLRLSDPSQTPSRSRKVGRSSLRRNIGRLR